MDQEVTPWRTVLRSADRLFRTTTHPAAVQLPVEGLLPSLAGATEWLNSSPLTPAGLRGSVVLVDFWTYTCINWLRTLPYLRAWAETYRDAGLVVLGVHTPEFPFEREVENVREAAQAMRVEYPIALDSDYAVWRAFGNRYWPAVYLADADGRIRYAWGALTRSHATAWYSWISPPSRSRRFIATRRVRKLRRPRIRG